MLARLAEGVGQLLVLVDRLGQLALGLEQALLERADPLRRVLQAAPQGQDLLLQRRAAARVAPQPDSSTGTTSTTFAGSDRRPPTQSGPLRTLHRPVRLRLPERDRNLSFTADCRCLSVRC